MKIINEDKQLAYDLEPDTVLDMERTNPFFNEQGEQSLPVDIPATEKNRNILGFADQIGSNQRGATRFDATILDGSFVATGRQAILSAQRKGKISTSFYLNEGALYSKIEEITLQQMFGDELIGSLSTVEECIAWCRTLLDGSNPNYCIFPALINGGVENDVQLYKWVNRYGYTGGTPSIWHDAIPASGSGLTADFYNAVDRTEMDGDVTISLPAGYYLTPFIRANYLLSRIFSYLGYTLNDNFFTQTAPFTEMVFCNSCIDTLANGFIKVSDIVPECAISVILDIYRKKFNCEFIPNEVSKTIDIVLFKDEIAATPVHDLTPYLVSQPDIDFPDYKQIQLSSESQVSVDGTAQSPASIPDLIKQYPTAYFNEYYGCFYREGYQGNRKYYQRVAPVSTKYASGDSMDIEDIVVPDCMPDLPHYPGIIYIGEPIERNSKVVLSDDSTGDSNDNEKQSAILAFFYTNSVSMPTGTISNYQYVGNTITKMWDYSLIYNGPEGLFEKFYRAMDNILRNSKHVVTAQLLLPETLRMSLPAYKLISLQGQSLFIKNLKYRIGGKQDPADSEFLTTKIHTPANLAADFDDYFVSPGLFIWEAHYSSEAKSEAQYNASPYKDRVITVVYPPIADALIYDLGSHYFEQKTCIVSGNSPTTYALITFWIEITVP